MKSNFSLKIVLLALSAVWTSLSYAGEYIVQLEKFTEQKGPGIAYAVTKSGKVIEENFFGYQDRQKEILAGRQTKFNLASNSKQFTAAAILILEERGLLSLNDNVSQYIAEWPTYAQAVKIRHLVFHTSGLPDYMSLCGGGKMVLNKDILDFLSKETKLYEPAGTKHEYSNTGYVVLSEIVQRVAKVSFDSFIEQEIFRPLQMTNSKVLSIDSSDLVVNRAVPYDDWPFFEIIDRRDCDYVFGDGGILTTTEDYGRWLNSVATKSLPFLKNPGRLFEAGSTDDGKPIDYGFGWQIDEYNGVRMLDHGGLWGGNKSFAAIFPDQGLSILVLSNYRIAPVWKVTAELANKFLNGQP
ncbi:MAG: serine hydrolase [Proteobacteria bacterium]|nr:serine hydrolase [Pseudomonadota bacterium]